MDPRCKETTRHGTVCGGVDSHVPGCPKNPLKAEFERQDLERVKAQNAQTLRAGVATGGKMIRTEAE